MGRPRRGFREALIGAALAAIISTGCRLSNVLPRPNQPIFEMSPGEVGALLGELARREPDVRRRVVELGRRHIGQAYRLGPLGEGGLEPYDTDPLYCLTASDCVTFVEQAWAMALSRDWNSFLQTLRRIRYKDGRVGMLTRNHFTEADWNINNAWLFDDVTARLSGGRAAAVMRVRIDRAAFFQQYGIGQGLAVQVFETTYIPVDRLDLVIGELRDADVIELVRGTRTAPYVGHMGLATHAADGTVTLLHSGKPAVAELPLKEYLGRHPVFIGVKILRVRDGAGASRN